MPLRKKGIWEVKEIVYIILILYILFLWAHIQRFSVKSLTAWWHYGMMTWWHNDQTVWCPVNRCRAGVLFVGPRREAQEWHPVLLANFSELSSKVHHPLGEFSQRFSPNFHQTFTKLSPTFTKLSPKGPKRGEKWAYFHFFFHFLSPEPIFLGGVERFAYLCTVSWDQRGPLTVLVFYRPHSAVSPPAPASWQSNRSITKGREKARRKTKKRTMRISHSQGITVVSLLHESNFCFHINHHSSRH